MENILNIANLSIGYIQKKQKSIVANNINLLVDTPKFISLIGENGIGKSTLLRTISKVQQVISGTIHLFDTEISKYSNIEIAQKISLVLTERIPPSNLTVYEVIALGRQVYTNWLGKLTTEDKNAINNAINQIKITDLQNKKIDELSDGQYQKVMIARAIAQDTPIIILDEPTAHLDIINKAIIFKLLKELVVKHRKTVIISSHELQLVLQSSDDLWLMAEKSFVAGSKIALIESGELQRLFTSELLKFNEKTNQFIFQ